MIGIVVQLVSRPNNPYGPVVIQSMIRIVGSIIRIIYGELYSIGNDDIDHTAKIDISLINMKILMFYHY